MDRFNFEEMIMECWGVTRDLDLLCEIVEKCDMPASEQDKLFNVLFGMKVMYEHKFEKLFESFETMIKDGTIT
jgi:hypothetical protein